MTQSSPNRLTMLVAAGLTVLTVASLAGPASAQDNRPDQLAQAAAPGGMMHPMHMHHGGMHHGPGHAPGAAGGHAAHGAGNAAPAMAGQDAFGAIQEIVRVLEADPRTDWSRVNIDALREHLIDMNEVTLRAQAKAERVDGGLRILVTGSGRTLEAIRRMVPAHAREINGQDGWSVTAEPVSDGVVLTVTAQDQVQTIKIRALGFMGIMVRGAHHQPHHLAMARGMFSHR